jgi:Fe-S cluster biosynthesis and repair protein YggX
VWCCQASPKEAQERIHSLVTLVAWELWKHRCDFVFNRTTSVDLVERSVAHEGSLW